MTELVAYDSNRFEAMEQIADYRYHGWTDTAIAKELGIQRKVVIELYQEYKDLLADDQGARDIAKDHLYAMIKHYDLLINKFYKLIEEIDDEIGVTRFTHQWAAQKQTTLKSIAELEAKRLDAIQKAGLLDNTELGDELAEAEEQMAILIDILRNDLCADCRDIVMHKMQKATGQVEVVVVPSG